MYISCRKMHGGLNTGYNSWRSPSPCRRLFEFKWYSLSTSSIGLSFREHKGCVSALGGFTSFWFYVIKLSIWDIRSSVLGLDLSFILCLLAILLYFWEYSFIRFAIIIWVFACFCSELIRMICFGKGINWNFFSENLRLFLNPVVVPIFCLTAIPYILFPSYISDLSRGVTFFNCF